MMSGPSVQPTGERKSRNSWTGWSSDFLWEVKKHVRSKKILNREEMRQIIVTHGKKIDAEPINKDKNELLWVAVKKFLLETEVDILSQLRLDSYDDREKETLKELEKLVYSKLWLSWGTMIVIGYVTLLMYCAIGIVYFQFTDRQKPKEIPQWQWTSLVVLPVSQFFLFMFIFTNSSKKMWRLFTCGQCSTFFYCSSEEGLSYVKFNWIRTICVTLLMFNIYLVVLVTFTRFSDQDVHPTVVFILLWVGCILGIVVVFALYLCFPYFFKLTVVIKYDDQENRMMHSAVEDPRDTWCVANCSPVATCCPTYCHSLYPKGYLSYHFKDDQGAGEHVDSMPECCPRAFCCSAVPSLKTDATEIPQNCRTIEATINESKISWGARNAFPVVEAEFQDSTGAPKGKLIFNGKIEFEVPRGGDTAV